MEGRGYHPDTSGTASAEYPYADCYAIRAISTSAKVNIYEGEFGGYGCTNAIGYETEKNFYIAGGHFKTSRLDETRINGKCLTISGTWITGVQQSMIDTLSKISCSSTEGLQGSTEVTVYKADPTLTFTTIPRVIVGKAFSMDLKGVGSGDLTYSITSGSLPSGLSLNIYTGIISGTPTPSAATSQFTVRVTDPAGAYTERTLYTVVEANDSYITSNESFTGKEGEFFAEHLTIDTEYAEVESMKLEKGPLPPGMSYSYSGQGMAVSGTPTAAGSYSVVFRIVRCDDYKTVYHTVNIVIEPKDGTVNLVNVVADWNDDCTKLANYSTYTKGCKITKVQYAKQRKEIFSCVPGDTIDLAFTVELESGYVFGTNCHTSWKGSAETARIEGATDRTKRFVYTLTVPHPESGISSFNDVSPSAYYADAVEWAVANGITNGTSATTFSPDAICTRAQVVTFLWRAVGKPAPTKKTNPFTDVKSNEYYYDAVLWAVEKGITSGMSATEFAPNSPCTRGQVVTFQWRAAGKPSPTSWNNPFTDVKSSAYYYNAVLWAVEKGITNGQDSTTFAPDKSCTRGQIVTFLYRQYK